jgi:chorismate dehydratase
VRVGRIPYVNCYPVYGAIDRGVVALDGTLITGVPSALNRRMAEGALDISVVSAVEYARDARRYLLLPDLAISCDGPVRSVMLFSRRPAGDLDGRRVIVSRSSMTSVALLELLFENVWHAHPEFVAGDAEMSDIASFDRDAHDARLVIGDAALVLRGESRPHVAQSDHKTGLPNYPFAYDLGETWKTWTGLPFVFAVWVAQRTAPIAAALGIQASLITSRNWGLDHLPTLATQAALATGVSEPVCHEYLSGLDYGLSYEHLAGLTEFFRRLVAAGRVPNGTLAFLPAA